MSEKITTKRATRKAQAFENETTKNRWDIINSAKLDMAGIEGVLEDMAKRDDYTNAELRGCMVRMAQQLHETRMKINEAIALPQN
jgi:hypothetical protein